jgi:hypothetical protein
MMKLMMMIIIIIFVLFLGMEQWWSEIDRGKQKYSGINLTQRRFVHHKSYTDLPRFEGPCHGSGG